jgi:hypothetical protein
VLGLALALLMAAPPDAALNLQLRAELAHQQEMERQRVTAQTNELMALEARLKTEQSLATLRLQSVRPVLPEPYLTGEGAAILPSSYPQIPDDRLAASNARVRAAAANRR